MNSPKHNYSNKKCRPIGNNNDTYIYFARSKAHSNIRLFFEGKIVNVSNLYHKIYGIEKETTSVSINIEQLLLVSYEKWENEFIKYIKGEFVILLYNLKTNQIKVFRDPIGIIPFYYYISNDTFYFSTELRRLSAIDNTPNFTYFKLCLQDFVPHTYDKTWFQNIKRLPAGSQLLLGRNSKTSINKYFHFQPIKLIHLNGYHDYLNLFRKKIETAILRQIEGNNHIFAHLSGGLDSTGICAIIQDYCNGADKQLSTYFSGLSNASRKNTYDAKDDYEKIKNITEHSNLSMPKIMSYDESTFLKNPLEPFQRPFIFDQKDYLIDTLEDIYKNNGKILLSGFGGDEGITFNERPFFLTDAFWNLKWKTFWSHKKLYGYKKLILAILYPFDFLDPIIKFFRPNIWLRGIKFGYYLKKEERVSVEKEITFDLKNTMILKLTSPWITYRIEQEKELASYYDIEMKYPYLDIDLLSFFLGLPPEYIIQKKGRKLYRDALEKWINYQPFITQPKGLVQTDPSRLLNKRKDIAEQRINFTQLIEELPNELKEIVNMPPIPKDWKDREDGRNYNFYKKIIHMGEFLKQTKYNNE